MSANRIRELLKELDGELRRTDDLDAETRAMLADLGERMDAADPDDKDSIRDSARELESRFAASHPTAERLAREIADLLTKMGI
jgi:hypothetical protein